MEISSSAASNCLCLSRSLLPRASHAAATTLSILTASATVRSHPYRSASAPRSLTRRRRLRTRRGSMDGGEEEEEGFSGDDGPFGGGGGGRGWGYGGGSGRPEWEDDSGSSSWWSLSSSSDPAFDFVYEVNHLQISAIDSSSVMSLSSLASSSPRSLPASSQSFVNLTPRPLRFLTRPTHVKPLSFLPLPRRLFLPSASAIWDALTGRDPAREASLAVRRGMQLFRQGDVSGSLVEFDRAIELDERQKAYLWQRGLSLYYLDRFEEGAEQFRLDVAQNPNDTEESIWCFLCEAQLYGVEEARRRFLEVGRDPRPVMREAYNLFKDGGDPEKLVSMFLRARADEYFYASLYAGLYHEAQNNTDAAKLNIIAACQSPYGSRSDDYMASLAKVHSLCRNWDLN
ncbi:hypothetical protein J5N97_018266 [Dioscorea zingiberensis]|uniref:Uncharacterized protein n=1 Tax=Dioscorea zingiberensis TaxID=325984 RepID=A0A9D5CMV7_9LILI|nr:hypothetical protein J5N97_018266 [Dioscorea zingiberensis]